MRIATEAWPLMSETDASVVLFELVLKRHLQSLQTLQYGQNTEDNITEESSIINSGIFSKHNIFKSLLHFALYQATDFQQLFFSGTACDWPKYEKNLKKKLKEIG